ncbi:mannitol dehydrogenase [Actinotalea ferrariae CF5-4]|uniref:Mannitol-1-phosphate 5-dehydrogenase n=1 Tax=Actinotalea ferrariae CF5-4 TaxID=948458 RepID=A0A021VQY0_9CELL|nr:mannitol dehydrogenase family protein [Actinotalea ferrariae]EYR62435.1 mannitol dehydrogenase [Actinotalea ferrariae CF5-4]
MTHLADAALPGLRPILPVPEYDRTSLRAGFVHVGVGGFHRAHQAMYVDRLLAAGHAQDWAICGVGLLPGDVRMRDALRSQDHLYTLVEKHPDGHVEDRVVGPLVDYLWAPEDVEGVVERMADPVTRVVSLTITEGGYAIDPVSREFAPSAVLREELASGAAPSSVFGIVTEALARRRERGLVPFTVLSCDNIQGNGEVARRAFTGYARLREAALGAWVEAHVAFPSSMVDRITPATTDDDRRDLAARTGVHDAWPVVCEPFEQWVLEDHFTGGRPPLEHAGVQLVRDVRPYELMKLRLLNAGHQTLAYLGHLLGHRYVHEAARDPEVAALLERYWREEAVPTLDPVPGVDLDDYLTTLLTRFGNPAVADTLERIATDTSDRIPTFLLPVVRDQLARGGPVGIGALVVASWARYAEGVDEAGGTYAVVDPLSDVLTAAAQRQGREPLAFLEVREVPWSASAVPAEP